MFVTYLEHAQSMQTLLIVLNFFLKVASAGTNAIFIIIPVTMHTLGPARQECCLNCSSLRTWQGTVV